MKKLIVDGKELLMDDDVYEFLKDKKIVFIKGGYPCLILHKMFFTDTKEGEIIDHKDRNVFNFTRNNLRKATYSENNSNKRKRTFANYKYPTIYKGVKFDKTKQTWIAGINKNKRQYSLGSYSTDLEASIIYDIAAIFFHQEFASLNHPAENYKNLNIEEEIVKIFTRQHSKNTSGYKGVFYDKKRNVYYARVKLNYKNVHVGTYLDAKEAAIARDNYCRLNGLAKSPVRFLNFPTIDELLEKLETYAVQKNGKKNSE